MIDSLSDAAEKKTVNALLIIAFIEGCSVLAVELLGGKIISSYYGSSLYVWTSVIGVTLFGLTCGYYIGGFLSLKKANMSFVFYIMIAASLFISLMSIIGPFVLSMNQSFSIFWGAILTSLLLITPPLILLGTITPMIIQYVNKNIALAGKVAGKIYALTTLGGIITSLVLGFWAIPNFGITYSLIAAAVLIGYYAFIVFSKKIGSLKSSIFIAFIAIACYLSYSKKNLQSFNGFDKIYESEGLLGQLKVVDHKSPREGYSSRRLLINGVPQTYIMKNVLKNSFWGYPHIISSIASRKAKNSDAAVLGVGGGSVVKELSELGFNVDAVDIDSRMFEIATNYFYLDKSHAKFHLDDARHYIRTCKKRYDVIVIDLLNGEVQPSYVFSTENFQDLKKNLKDDGILIINFQGNSNAPAAQSIFNTLSKTGFYTYYSLNGEPGDEVGDIIFTAALKNQDFSAKAFENINDCCKHSIGKFIKKPLRNDLIRKEFAYLLEDDKPLLDQLNKKGILEYRKHQTQAYIKKELEIGNKTFN